MAAKQATHQERLAGILHRQGPALVGKQADAGEAEASSGAFGSLRGPADHVSALEFHFRDGKSTWFPYGWLGPFKFNPSEGILLKYSGDMLYLVLIQGSNLDMPLPDGGINLTGGLQRQKITWVREMPGAEIKRTGETAPTVDSIEVAECESQAAIREWLSKKAPAFLH